MNNNLVSVYPNPSKGNIYNHSNYQNGNDGSVIVYNMQGQEVYNTNQLPPDGLLKLPFPDGVYTLRYSTMDEYCVKRIFIDR